MTLRSRDFKSLVSTYSTTRAREVIIFVSAGSVNQKLHIRQNTCRRLMLSGKETENRFFCEETVPNAEGKVEF